MARQICKIEADVWNDWGSVSKYSILSILFQLTEIEIVIYIYYRRQSGLLVIQVATDLNQCGARRDAE